MVKMPSLLNLQIGTFLTFFALVSAHAQQPACHTVSPHSLSPAEKAYSDGYYSQAEQLYAQGVAARPQDAVLAARLIESLLHEDKLAQAEAQLSAAVSANPSSAAVLTAQAEVQLREGEPWRAMKSLDAAAAADPCFARVHLVRSRIFRLDSMYASERSELQKAYEIDVTDPDILMAWSRIMPAAQEIQGSTDSLATMKGIDANTRARVESTIHSLMPLLYESSQTCKVLPVLSSETTVPLLPSRVDGKHIDAFRVEVNFPKGTAKLELDTAASGLFISKALADQNGFERAVDAPMGTVQADTVRIGPLEFHDCMVGVSDTPFSANADGFIGTDILSPYLITVDAREQKLKLDPLPPAPSTLPGDRVRSGELSGYEPVYHRKQYLLVPVTIDKKTQKLFALDTGMRISAMNPETAHSVSDIKVNFTNPVKTKTGETAQLYRDNFDFQFAGMSLDRQEGILAFEPTVIDHNTDLDVGGMLGFDVLGRLTMHLDYRDGLVKFETPESEELATKGKKRERGDEAGESQECAAIVSEDIPLNQTLELKVTGTLDSAHLKPGKEIYAQVVNGLSYPGCILDRDSMVYGRVTSVSSSRNPDAAELSVAFDHGDCEKQSKKPLSLHLIALLPPPDAGINSLHGAVPTEVSGGARQISDAVAATTAYDAQLSEGGKPHTVHPGAVVGMPRLKLDPVGGPGCSARITSSTRNVQLGTGAELILALSTAAPH